MKNPFRLLKVFLKARRPTLVADMPVFTDDIWLRRGYGAMTFFGTIVTACAEEAHRLSDKRSTLRNHEMIHLSQARTCHDSWLLFYWLYGWYYVQGLPQNRRLRNAAYRLNPFEMEAYAHMHDLHYTIGHEAEEWRLYARMKSSERLRTFLSARSPQH